jgi:hypothetical protein
MDGSKEPAPTQATLDNPKKRAASRSPSISPSQAQQFKKIRYEDDNQNMNDHVSIFSPRTRPHYLQKAMTCITSS